MPKQPGGDGVERTASVNVLLLNQYFPPDTSATAHVWADIARALDGRGHQIRVLTGRPSYELSDRRAWRLSQQERDMHAVVEAVGSTSFQRHGMAGRVANYLTYLPLVAWRGRRGQRPDVVIAGTDPPLAVWSALTAARGAPVVYGLQDLHPDMALAGGMVSEGVVSRTWDRAHVSAMRRCSVVVVIGEAMADRISAKGVPDRRIEVVPNGAAQPTGRSEPDVVDELRAGSSFVALHAGNLGGAGPWDALEAAARKLPDGCEILFVGAGIHADGLRRRGHVRVLPFRPASQIPSVQAAGNLQIVAQRTEMVGLVVPSKLYTALAHGRPVLAVAPEGSEVVRVVREFDCGLVADPSDPADIAGKIVWTREHPDELARMAAASKEAGRFYERGRQLDRFVDIVERAARGEYG